MSALELLEAEVAAYRAYRQAQIRLQEAQQKSGRAVVIARGGGTPAKDAWARVKLSPQSEAAMHADIVSARDAHLAAVERVTMAMEAT